MKLRTIKNKSIFDSALKKRVLHQQHQHLKQLKMYFSSFSFHHLECVFGVCTENERLLFSKMFSKKLLELIKRRSNVHGKNMLRELALNFETNDKHFPKIISQ